MRAPLITSLCALCASASQIDRHSLVARYNPTRNASSSTTPIQVGNGNFAFGADITGLQTLQPWAIMSTWGWKNDSFPTGMSLEDVLDYTGVSLDNHGRLVEYMFNGAQPMQQWMISNPNRVNLGAVGLVFRSQSGEVLNVTEADLTAVEQELDLWTGTLTSKFQFQGVSAQTVDNVGVTISSPLLKSGQLGLFVDFPWNDGSLKFSDPFVGTWNNASIHTTTLNTTTRGSITAEIAHTLVNSTFVTSLGGDAFTITRDSPTAHRYTIHPTNKESSVFALSTAWGLTPPASVLSPAEISSSSAEVWEEYWMGSGFVDVFTGSSDPRADELQRRIILSRYLMRVNEAGDFPPQERAQVQQGWPTGARWGKMSDPSGQSSPLLIWQQPHPLVFANYEYRANPTLSTLKKWEAVVRNTADWMATFAWFNTTTGFYDLGPPLYVVAEDNNYNNTYNPAFELAYWRLGLGIAEEWMQRLGEPSSTGLDDGLDLQTSKLTTEKVWGAWNISNVWGWDFPLLAMSAARIGEQEQAIEWLLHPLFQFDDAGMPVGGVRVPTPYFPGSGGLLYAIAMMAEGWDGSNGTAPGFPAEGWNVRAEGMSKAM
ncbi:hypothetical protein FB45DRAFT_992308 [Roridomyces roridus]|uniref:Six-hairpin glycosidase-like protein n=1 Tax=Roridomyces roridus TaxID=1738132 RepID=A0AAD7BHK8_9AGAR|nr:hypothetical protein FB45DRAFT_992308 [Roridomyces roridus]